MVLFWLLVQATVAADADVSPLTNIGYVGRGYNQFLGNPHASVVDPGFRASVFDVSQYGSGRVTADRRFQTPDGVDAYPALSCDSQFFSTEITDANAFTTALRASVAGDMKMAPFSGNVEYRKIRERTTLARSVFIESTSTCEVYVARIRMFDPPALAGEFVTAVRGLPPQYSNETLQEYNSFLNYFGTHVVVNIALGARLGVLHEFDAVQFARMLGEGVKVKVAANANSGFVFGQVGLGTTFDHQQSDAFQRQRLSVSTFTTGTRLPPNADPDLWLQSAIDDPVPVRYTLVPIAEFVGDALRGEVDRAVATLCNYVPGARCTEPERIAPPAPLCPETVYFDRWQPVNPCIWGMSPIQTHSPKLLCAADEALAAVRLSHSMGSLRFDIGCAAHRTIGMDFVDWTAPQRVLRAHRRNATLSVTCPDNTFAAGLGFWRYCLTSSRRSLVGLQCRQSRLPLGSCAHTPWRTGIQALPSWAEASCPGNAVLSGLEIHGDWRGWTTLNLRLRCCVVSDTCVDTAST
ncbi:unnamed protein product (mitochondrion) [Plasmodiophora brassicae]|uniref:MACPF domain-containing protein n=1 Tax=Plasmodiophora brassicae TaxID=37360 RepID=A0A3P3Y694_PLABS|nr:unnamed protein product [Plasmodiophora brassicae]